MAEEEEEDENKRVRPRKRARGQKTGKSFLLVETAESSSSLRI